MKDTRTGHVYGPYQTYKQLEAKLNNETTASVQPSTEYGRNFRGAEHLRVNDLPRVADRQCGGQGRRQDF